MSRSLLALLCLAATFAPPAARADDKVWSAVLYASNASSPKEPPEELKPIAGRLKRVFGYNQYEIIGSDDAQLTDGGEFQLKPTKMFWMNVKARRASIKEARGGYLFSVQLYQEKRALVDTVALFAPDSPLFFRGPLHGKGQILIVLQVIP